MPSLTPTVMRVGASTFSNDMVGIVPAVKAWSATADGVGAKTIFTPAPSSAFRSRYPKSSTLPTVHSRVQKVSSPPTYDSRETRLHLLQCREQFGDFILSAGVEL